MTRARAIAAPVRALTLALALALALTLLNGCAALREKFKPTPARSADGEPSAGRPAPPDDAAASPTLGVRIEIDAPGPLKNLLERHLDLVRLSRADSEIRREDIDDTEWSRLIDAAPA